LIVNADDFGLTSGVNRAIAELHDAGVLTSATLMARARATDEAIQLAIARPRLGVGCHLVLVDGQPVLPSNEIASLLDPKTGEFYPTLGRFLPRLVSGRLRAEQLEAEASAQIRHLQARGIKITHIDTHKHTHMFPTVLRAVLRAARKAGISAVRNPFEPEWAVRTAKRAPWLRRAEVMALRTMGPRCLRIMQEEGFRTTDGTIAVAATGILDASDIKALLDRMPEGRWEFVTHPGYNDAELAQVRTRLRESRNLERQALIAIREARGVELQSFAAV
jgi:hopanoid biosynthesis associated protein HpnK